MLCFAFSTACTRDLFSVRGGGTISGSEKTVKPYLWLLAGREQLHLQCLPLQAACLSHAGKRLCGFLQRVGVCWLGSSPRFPGLLEHSADHRQIFRHQCTQTGILSALSHRDTIFNQALGRTQQLWIEESLSKRVCWLLALERKAGAVPCTCFQPISGCRSSGASLFSVSPKISHVTTLVMQKVSWNNCNGLLRARLFSVF